MIDFIGGFIFGAALLGMMWRHERMLRKTFEEYYNSAKKDSEYWMEKWEEK